MGIFTPEEIQRAHDAGMAALTRKMDDAGLTEEYLIGKLKRELSAKETKFFQHQGEVITRENVVAWDVRQRARIDAHKLRGDYPAEKREHTFPFGVPVLLGELTEAERKALKAAEAAYIKETILCPSEPGSKS